MRFEPDRHGLELATKTPEMLNALEQIGEDIKAHAQNLAPVDDGDYRDGIEVVTGVEGDTGMGRVNANDWKSGFIEFGTAGPTPTPTFAPLRRGAEAAGHPVSEVRK